MDGDDRCPPDPAIPGSNLTLRSLTDKDLIMNRIARLAAFAFSVAAAGSAFAESPAAGYAPGAAGTSAAAVVGSSSVAPSLAAPRGLAVVTEADLNRATPVAQTQSRQAVRAATRAALAQGEIRVVDAELSPFSGAPVVAVVR